MKEIQKQSITEAVVKNIKELIESGEVAVGEKLPAEKSLCETLKVSRTSVREALRMLQAMGYVKMILGKGAFVDNYAQAKTMKADWCQEENIVYYDYMEVRVAIETLAVRLSVSRATEKQIEELAEIHNNFVLACNQADILRMIMLDEAFHTKIMSFTNNTLLISMNKQLVDMFRNYRCETFTNPETYRNAIDPHTCILNCFTLRDPERAVREMQRHLDISIHDMQLIKNQVK